MPSNLQVYDLDSIGSAGLNTQEASISLPGPYASIATNAEFTSEGILRPRPLLAKSIYQPPAVTTGLHIYKYTNSSNITFEYFYSSNSTGSFYTSSGFNSTWAACPGVYTTGDANYTSVRLQDKVYFFTRELTPKVADLSVIGAINDIADINAPKAHIACAAFGRLWAADTSKATTDKRTLYWSVLLDGTDWTGVGSGSLDLSYIWGTGDDEITAIKEFNGFLIVFSLHRITIFNNPFNTSFDADGNTSQATTMSLQDLVVGIGCLSRDVLVDTGEDVFFLNFNGIYSLSRIIQEKSSPIGQISQNIHDVVQEMAKNIRKDYVSFPNGAFGQMYWHPVTKQLFLSYNSNTYCFHMNRRLENGAAVVTKWDYFTPYSTVVYENSLGYTDVYNIADYGAYTNVFSVFLNPLSTHIVGYEVPGSYSYTYASTWETFKTPGYTKYPKRLYLTYQGSSPGSVLPQLVTVKLKFNYDSTTEQTFTFTPKPGTGYRVTEIPIGGSGETVMTTISYEPWAGGPDFRINRLSYHYKSGRINSGL